MRKLSAVCFIFSGLFLILAMLLSSVFTIALDLDFYKSEYEKLNQAKVIGIREEDLTVVTSNLLSYTTGNRENLDMVFEINGETREVFNQKEKEHMVDVQILATTAMNINTVLYILFGVFLVLGLIFNRRLFFKRISKTYLWVCGIFSAFLGAVGAWAAMDFSSFWRFFHMVFFTNDLWILNPQKDILIMMVPSQFFFDLIMNIIGMFLLLFGILVLVCILVLIIANKKQRKLREKIF